MKAYLTLFVIFCMSVINATEMQGFLTKEEIQLFYSQGYFLKPKAISQKEMATLKEQVTNVIDRALDEVSKAPDQVFSEDEQVILVDGSNVVFKRRPNQSTSIARIRGVSGIEPGILKTMRSEKMIHTFYELLGTNDIEQIISQIHPKLPGDKIAFPKHRDIQFRKAFDPDWQDILGNGSYAICIIPIDHMNPENGGLWIDRNNYPEPQGLEPDLVWIYAEPGDILFMHPYLTHGSEPNPSGESRKTLLAGFCAFGANHKAYPGAHVNARLTLQENNEITVTPAPWSKDQCVGPLTGH